MPRIASFWNRFVFYLASLCSPRQGVLKRFLSPRLEKHNHLFGRYAFSMDLGLGNLQRTYFLKPKNYEADTLAVLKQVVRENMVVLDIGANSGYLTLFLTTLVGKKGRVIAFEPSQRLFKLLEENVKQNNLDNVVLFQLALSNAEGRASMHLNPKNDGGNCLGDVSRNSDFQGTESRTELVATRRVDDVLSEINVGKVDVVKIDVEGAEGIVFEGAENLLSHPFRPIILCEVSETAQSQFGSSEIALREQLYRYGYRSFYPNGQSLAPSTRVKGLQNLVFVPAHLDPVNLFEGALS